MSKDKPKDENAIGFGKPPKNTQFKKGVSGNPTGRPRKPVDFDQKVLREASLHVVIMENGRQIRITKHDVALRQLLHKAMKGDVNAMKMFFAYYQQALERASLLAAQQATNAAHPSGSRAEDLSDDELMAIICASEGYKDLKK